MMLLPPASSCMATKRQLKLLLASLLLCSQMPATAQAQAQTSEKSSAASSPATPLLQPIVQLADQLQIRYQLLDGRFSPCPNSPLALEPGCFRARLQLSVPATATSHFPTNWQLLFSHLSPVIKTNSSQFRLEHLNGDLHRLTPTEQFPGWQAGSSVSVEFIATASIFSQFYLPGNYWLQDSSGQTATVKSTVTPPALPEAPSPGRPAFVAPFVADQHSLSQHWVSGAALYQQEQQAMPAPDTHPSEQATLRLIPQPAVIRYPTDHGLASQAIPLSSHVVLEATPELQQQLAVATSKLQQLLQQQGGSLQNKQLNKPAAAVSLHIQLSRALASEAYRLSIRRQRISLQAGSAAGAYYGLQTLHMLAEQGELPALDIEDQPAFAYRGQHLDIARNFPGYDFIARLIPQLGRYKMNKLHLHLADDEGWRLQIPALPELTELGARRCYDLTEQRCLLPQLGAGNQPDALPNGYLSSADYQALLKLAASHFIEVIPSIDMPGHSRAAIKAMDLRAARLKASGDANWQQHLLSEPADRSRYLSIQYYHDNTLNPCLPGTYQFFRTVLDELQQLHQQAGVPLQHYQIGADETAGAWRDSPACRQLTTQLAGTSNPNQSIDLMAYFLTKLQQELTQRGLPLSAWSDGLKHLTPASAKSAAGRSLSSTSPVQSYLWQTSYSGASETAHQQANQGWQVVLALPDALYLDVPALENPAVRGNHWASRGLSLQRIFQFHPANLPANALFFPDVDGKPVQNDDRHILTAPKQIIGLQGNLWTELVPDARSAGEQLLPRLLAIADRSWHLPAWQLPYKAGQAYQPGSPLWTAAHQQSMLRDWQAFARRLWTLEAPHLVNSGLSIQLPWVGVKRQQQQLTAQTAAGLTIQYRLPKQQWQSYQGPVNGPDETEFRAVLQFNSGANLQVRYGPVSRVTNEWSDKTIPN